MTMRAELRGALRGIALLLLTGGAYGAEWEQVYKVEPAATASAAPAPANPALESAAQQPGVQPGQARARAQVPAGGGARGQNPGTRAATTDRSARGEVLTEATRATPAPPVASPADPVIADIERGKQLLASGQIAAAAQVFHGRAMQATTPAEQAGTLFRLGVQWQREVVELPVAQQSAAWKAAADAYQEMLRLNPNSGPALNNIAQIYRQDPARRVEADAYLERAVALNDTRKSVYQLNRAELKRDMGDLRAAAELAGQVAALDKENLQAHRLMMEIALLRDDATPLLQYIDELNTRGQVVRSLDSAAAGLGVFARDRKRILVSVAQTLGNSAYTADPSAFEQTDAGLAIGKFMEDPAIGAGVIELFRTLRAPVPAAELRWWRDGFDQDRWPREGSPTEAMQNLTRRCGEIHHANADARTEGYYRMSVELNGRMNADPRALLGLADILYQQQRLDDLSRLLAANEPGMLEAKMRSLRISDHLHTYQLRLALGMMYGYVERWKSTDPYYAASIWMLEHAQESAENYNGQANVPRTEQIKLPPAAVNMLSTGYARTGDASGSVSVRLNAAERFLQDGQVRYARQVLDDEWQRSLSAGIDAALLSRLDQLKARLAP